MKSYLSNNTNFAHFRVSHDVVWRRSSVWLLVLGATGVWGGRGLKGLRPSFST